MRLRADIDGGRISQTVSDVAATHGGYLFVTPRHDRCQWVPPGPGSTHGRLEAFVERIEKLAGG